MKQMIFIAALLGGMLAGCSNSNKLTTDNDMKQELELTQEWDKVFPLSEKVSHRKVTFKTQYGQTLAADLYLPKDAEGKLPAIAVSGPFGAVKEQSSGLYAMKMAERGFVALAFDPSYTGESSGEPVARHRPTSTLKTLWLLLISYRNKMMWMPRRLASSASAAGVASP